MGSVISFGAREARRSKHCEQPAQPEPQGQAARRPDKPHAGGERSLLNGSMSELRALAASVSPPVWPLNQSLRVPRRRSSIWVTRRQQGLRDESLILQTQGAAPSGDRRPLTNRERTPLCPFPRTGPLAGSCGQPRPWPWPPAPRRTHSPGGHLCGSPGGEARTLTCREELLQKHCQAQVRAP